MSTENNRKLHHAITIKREQGLLNELRTPAQVMATFTTDNQSRIKNVSAIWDTGAQKSVISCSLAKQLKLISIGKIDVRGVHSNKIVNQYKLQIIIMNQVNVSVKVSEGDLHQNDGVQYSQTELLIGMDVIALGDFFIGQFKSPNGTFAAQFSFRIPSNLTPIDYVEIENGIRLSTKKKYIDNHSSYKPPHPKKHRKHGKRK